jgi:type VI secretion system secreted protein VgrG
LTGDGVPDGAQVASYTGVERVGAPYVFDLVVAMPSSTTAAQVAAALFDTRICLTLSDAEGARTIGGVVVRVAYVGTIAHDRYTLRLRVVPGLALLRRRRVSRIFQNVSVPEVVSQILALAQVDFRLAMTTDHPKREYCVQYRESDLDFVTRLLREEGIVLTFDDPADASTPEVVVLWDGGAPHGPITGDPSLSVREAPAGQSLTRRESDVFSVVVEQRDAPRAKLVQNYDPLRPTTALVSGAIADEVDVFAAPTYTIVDQMPSADEPGLVYEHLSDYDAVDVKREAAGVRLEQARRRALELRASGLSARLAVGRTFQLQDYDLTSFPTELLVTEIHHTGKSHEISGKDPTYQTAFVCIPSTLVPRPKHATRAPMQVTETAVVVGPGDEEANTEEFGRVKIQFHWDLDGGLDDKSSCWVRVLQPWAGDGFGSVFLPRVGMEVLVTFIGGDLDRPIVLGSLYHAVNNPPFGLPDGKLTSGLVTQSAPGGDGGHVLSFDDTKGNELLRVSSEKKLELAAKAETVISSGAGRLDTVNGDMTLMVATNRSATVTGDDRREVKGNTDYTHYGTYQALVMGTSTVRGDDHVAVTLGSGGELVSQSSFSMQVEGDHTLIVGVADNSVAQTSVTGRYALGASDTILIKSDKTITLQVGDNSIEISQDGVKIEAKAITLKAASVTATGAGPSLSLGDEAKLTSQKVTVETPGASLTMDSALTMKSQSIAMKPPTPSQPPPPPPGQDAKTKDFKVKLCDELIQPYASKHYELFAEGSHLAGSTTADGEIDAKVPEAATRVDVTLWLDDYPTGRTKMWSIAIGIIPAASTPRGALMRLHNLGYYPGAPVDALGDAETAALQAFQRDNSIDDTGQLDAATSSQLETVHGS